MLVTPCTVGFIQFNCVIFHSLHVLMEFGETRCRQIIFARNTLEIAMVADKEIYSACLFL
uniref:Uncharacterized protein n=1 Tax=Arundo donax TaxID=35708 RepID=A0A0A9B6P0_ARUDO